MTDVKELQGDPGPGDDRPLDNPATDRLGYAPFAKHLAQTLVRMIPGDGLVIGLYGPWGSGKTTILNFVESYLEGENPGQFSVMHFNPWWFGTSEDLVHNFLDQLRDAFSRGGRLTDLVRDGLADLAGAASKAPIPSIWAKLGISGFEWLVRRKPAHWPALGQTNALFNWPDRTCP